jgi:YVTN family beta-propeller protein
VSPASRAVYVTDRNANAYYTVNTTNFAASTTSLSSHPQTFGKPAVTPDGTELWIPFLQPSAGAAVIDVGAGEISRFYAGPANTSQIAFSPDGTAAYLLVSPPTGNGSINSLNSQTGAKNWTAATGPNPKGLFVTPQGMYLSVANSGDGTVSVIDASTGTTVSTKAVGMTPVGVEINH